MYREVKRYVEAGDIKLTAHNYNKIKGLKSKGGFVKGVNGLSRIEGEVAMAGHL